MCGLSSPQCKDKEGCLPLAEDRRMAGCAWRGAIFLSHRPGVSIQPSLGLHHTSPRERKKKEEDEKLNVFSCCLGLATKRHLATKWHFF